MSMPRVRIPPPVGSSRAPARKVSVPTLAYRGPARRTPELTRAGARADAGTSPRSCKALGTPRVESAGPARGTSAADARMRGARMCPPPTCACASRCSRAGVQGRAQASPRPTEDPPMRALQGAHAASGTCTRRSAGPRWRRRRDEPGSGSLCVASGPAIRRIPIARRRRPGSASSPAAEMRCCVRDDGGCRTRTAISRAAAPSPPGSLPRFHRVADVDCRPRARCRRPPRDRRAGGCR